MLLVTRHEASQVEVRRHWW